MLDAAYFGHEYGLVLAIGAAIPFILRSIVDWIIGFILHKCHRMRRKEMKRHMIDKSYFEVTIDSIWDKTISWSGAKNHLGINECGAVLISFCRLIFWHCMQPIVYAYILYAYWDSFYQSEHQTTFLSEKNSFDNCVCFVPHECHFELTI